MKIKWIRLSRIVKKIINRDITITLSTSDQLKGLMSAVRFTADTADIILSSSCKTLNMIIKAIAHETAHIVQGNDKHNNRFTLLWEKLEDKIKKEYNS